MSLKRTLSLAILLCSLMVNLPAQRRWTLDDCISFAQQSDLALKKHEMAVRQQEEDLKLARKSWQPNVSLDVEQDFGHGNLAATASGFQLSSTDPYSASFMQAALQLEMPLLDGSLLKYRQHAARYQLEASMQNLQAARHDLSIRITTCYVEVYYYCRLLAISRLEMESDLLLQERCQQLYGQDACSMSDISKARSMVQAAELVVLSYEEQYRMKLLQLAQIIGLDEVEGFAIDTTVVIDPATPKVITDADIESNPRMQSAAAQLSAAKELSYQAKRELFPKLSLYGMVRSYYYQLYDDDLSDLLQASSFGRQFFDENKVELIGLKLSIPIWNAGRQQSAVKKARMDVIMKQFDIADTRQQLYHELQQIQEQVAMAQMQYDKAMAQMQTTAECYNYTNEGYEAGHNTLYDLDVAKVSLMGARMNVEKWKTTLSLRKRILEFYLNH